MFAVRSESALEEDEEEEEEETVNIGAETGQDVAAAAGAGRGGGERGEWSVSVCVWQTFGASCTLVSLCSGAGLAGLMAVLAFAVIW